MSASFDLLGTQNMLKRKFRSIHSFISSSIAQSCACLQVVAFQAMMEMMATEFPGAFSGYSLAVTESHQRAKADTSGTAKAVVSSLQRLGLDFKEVTARPHVFGVHLYEVST